MAQKNDPYADLKQFAIQIATTIDVAQLGFIPSISFSTKKFGGMAFSGQEADKYSELLGSFAKIAGELMSRRSVAKLIETALLKTADLRKENAAIPAQVRAEQAVREVRAALASKHLSWVNCIPLIGLTPPKRPWRFSGVTIIDISRKDGREILTIADKISDSTTDTLETKEHAKAELRKHLITDHPNQAFALVITNALDAEAAWVLARQRLSFILDCLNFIIDMVHGPSKYYAISYEEPRARHFASGLTINVTDHSSARIPGQLNPAAMNANAEELRNEVKRHPALRRLWAFLSADAPSAHMTRVLSGVHWAGRAGAEPREEQAFLFRAIALESLILGDTENSELTLRLTLSVVHLLANQFKSREVGARMLKGLYGVRSKIVHSGKYQVDESDNARMREVVIRSLLQILGDRRFSKMIAKDDLTNWFIAKMRGDTRD